MIQSKYCAKCNQNKPFDMFYKNRKTNILRTYCKECESVLRKTKSSWQKDYNKKYNQINKHKILTQQAEYYEKHKDKINEYSINYSRYRVTYQPEINIFSRTKSRAKKLNIKFNLTIEDIVIPKICPVLGIEIIPSSNGSKRGPRPNSPSIDRIEPSKGYVKGNIRIISNRANTLKCDATVSELELILRDLLKIHQ